MHSSTKVNIAEAIALVQSSSPTFVEGLELTQTDHDEAIAVQVFRACHDELEAETEETIINILDHHAGKLCWYHKIVEHQPVELSDVINSEMFRIDQAMGLRGPSYGELIWHETGDLTPSITRDLPAIYQIAFRLRSLAHELHSNLPVNQARLAFNAAITEMLSVN